MRIFKTVGLTPRTLKLIEETFGDLKIVNFSQLTDKAINCYLESVNANRKTMAAGVLHD